VTRGVVARDGRTGEDELAPGLTVVDGMTYVVPELGLNLPLIEEARRRALEKDVGVHGEGLSRCDGVQPYLAASGTTSRLGLADGLGSLDDDRADGVEGVEELGIEDAGHVVHVRQCHSARTLLSMDSRDSATVSAGDSQSSWQVPCNRLFAGLFDSRTRTSRVPERV
jgi:hypothetical protein